MINKKTVFGLIFLLVFLGCEEKRTVPKVENKAPQYSLNNKNGQTIHSKDSEGKIRLVVFWATWCKPCLEEIPVLNDLYQRYQGHPVEIHAISVDRASDSAKVHKFIDKYGLNYPVLWGSPQLQTEFRSNKVPTTYLLNQKGEYVRKWNGPQPAHIFIREIEKLVKITE